MNQLKDCVWFDFSPRTRKEAIGHYLPLHQAWSNAAKQNGMDWTLISTNFSSTSLNDDFGNLLNQPEHFSIRHVINFSEHLNRSKTKYVNILVYEGNFVTFYFFLFISRLCRKKVIVHFNWSNNNQLLRYANKFYFKWVMNILYTISKRNFVHYVENETLKNTLNIKSNLYFSLFPTSTVFSIEKSEYAKINNSKLTLFINDKDFGQVKFDKVIERIEQVFLGMEVNIFSSREFEVPAQMSNIYVTYNKQIDNSAYFLALNGTWISIFFYNENNYQVLTSGRFLDCLSVDSLICVPYESKCLDWLGKRFGNYYHINIFNELSNYDIDKLFEMNTEVPKFSFSPDNTIQILINNGENLKQSSKIERFTEKFFHPAILTCIYVVLQIKFILLLIMRRSLKKKFSILVN